MEIARTENVRRSFCGVGRGADWQKGRDLSGVLAEDWRGFGLGTRECISVSIDSQVIFEV